MDTRSLAARTQLAPWSGDRDAKPPMVGLVPAQARVNFTQLGRQASQMSKGLYESNIPTLRSTPDDLGLFQGQMAFVVPGATPLVNGTDTGYPFVQTSLNGFNGLPREDMAMFHQELLKDMPHNRELVERLVQYAVQSRIVVLGQVMEDVQAVDEKRNMRHSQNPTSILVRGLIAQFNLTNKPMQVGQSVVFRPMTFEQAERPHTLGKFKTGEMQLRPYAVGVVATTEDYTTLAERQEAHMQLYLRNTDLYLRLFNASHSRIGRCEVLACEEIARGQLLQGVAFVGGLLDAGIVRFNGPVADASVQDLLDGEPHAPIPKKAFDSDFSLKPAKNCADVLMFAKQMTSPFLAREDRSLLYTGDVRNDVQVRDGNRVAICAYKTLPFQVQLAEMLLLVPPSSEVENSQFAGITRQWFQSADNRQAALALRDVLLRRMNVCASNESVQALAHEPGSYRIALGPAASVDNAGYASSSSSGVRAPNVNTGHGRLLYKMQMASRMVSLGHAQLFAAHGVHGVVTQSAPVNGMAHIFLGGGTGRQA